MTLRAKLLLAQVPMLVALIALVFLQRWSVSAVGGAAQNILRENYRSVLAAQRMQDALLGSEAGARLVLSTQRERGLQQLSESRQRFESALAVQASNLTEPGEHEATTRLQQHWRAYLARIDLWLAPPNEERAGQLYATQIEPAFLAAQRAADAIVALNQEAMVRKSDQARHTAQRVSQLAALAALSALILGIAASLLLTARLLQPLVALRAAAARWGAGQLDARAAAKGDDEIAQLAADFNGMAEQLKRYRQSSLGQLLAAQQAAQSAIDSIPDPVLIFDAAGVLVKLNRAAGALLPPAPESSNGDLLQALDSAPREALTRLRAHILAGHGAYAPKDFSEAISVGRGDEQRSFLPRATPVCGVAGAIEGATIILQDITWLRRFDELKDDLVATVAHELRTPLTSLRMAVHLCLEGVAGPVSDPQIALLHTAREDCERLQGIVEDLLNLARIASGRVQLRRLWVSVDNLVGSAVAECQGLAQQKNIELVAEISPLSPRKIWVDPERLALVFNNLVSNALRHTPPGGRVCLRVPAAGKLARFEVIDTGVGIAVEYQRQIFLRFFRVPGSVAGGAGLGLSIAKEIVEAHGGQIGVCSELDHGSTFYFLLPLADLRAGATTVSSGR